MKTNKKKWLVMGFGGIMVIALGFIAYRTIKKGKEQKLLDSQSK